MENTKATVQDPSLSLVHTLHFVRRALARISVNKNSFTRIGKGRDAGVATVFTLDLTCQPGYFYAFMSLLCCFFK